MVRFRNVLVEHCPFNISTTFYFIFPQQENASPNTALMTLTATDKDEGLNGEVFYSVLDIRPQNDYLPQPTEPLIGVHADSGVVFVNASLIGHPGAFNVTFVAYDSAEEPNNATTLLVVYVRDVNINAPRFVVPDQDLVNTSAKLVPNITVDEVTNRCDPNR